MLEKDIELDKSKDISGQSLYQNSVSTSLEYGKAKIVGGELLDSESQALSEVESVEEYSVDDEVLQNEHGEVDLTQPVVTIRVIVVLTVFNFVWAFINQFGRYRTVPLAIDASSAYILSYPILMFLAKYIPRKQVKIFGLNLDSNPGPFTVREHILVGVSMSDATSYSYVTNTLYMMEEVLNNNIGWIGDFLFVVITKMIGVGLAALFYRLLIYSKNLPWITAVFNIEIFKMLHTNTNDRLKMFGYVFAVFFIYTWIPSYLWLGLSAVSILCWGQGGNSSANAHKKKDVIQVIGRGSTDGFGILSTDFALSDITGSVSFLLYAPAWIGLNAVFGGILWQWVISPIAYYSNYQKAQNFPAVGTSLYLENGDPYPLDELFVDNVFQEDVYEQAGRPYVTSYFAFSYFFAFVAISSSISHTIVWHWDDLKSSLSSVSISQKNSADVKSPVSKYALHLESQGSSIPLWVGFSLTVIFSGIFIAMNYVYNTLMPWWAVILSLGIACTFIIPVGAIQAVTGNQIGLNILSELIGGLALSHNPNGAILVKVVGYQSMAHAVNMIQWLKAGQYLAVSYGTVLSVQLYGILITSLADTTAYRMVMDADLMNKEPEQFHSSSLHLYVSASYLWGGIGSWDSWVSPNSRYPFMFWGGLAVGAVTPIIFWLLTKHVHRSFKYVHIPVWCIFSTYPYTYSWFITSTALIISLQILYPLISPQNYKKYIYIVVGGIITGVGICGFVISIARGFLGLNPVLTDFTDWGWLEKDAGCYVGN
eukprot:Nk52_evm34s485 gene=Nk52_evmTU34s485